MNNLMGELKILSYEETIRCIEQDIRNAIEKLKKDKPDYSNLPEITPLLNIKNKSINTRSNIICKNGINKLIRK